MLPEVFRFTVKILNISLKLVIVHLELYSRYRTAAITGR